LAIDASLWIVKVNSIFENLDEGLKCLFNKIVWLKRHNIKPIFVFDGESPALKRKTLEERRHRRSQLSELELSKKVEIEIGRAM
jgi:DNA excision repair protein ERCC-5